MGISCIKIVKYTVLKLLFLQLTEDFMLLNSFILLLFLMLFFFTDAKRMK